MCGEGEREGRPTEKACRQVQCAEKAVREGVCLSGTNIYLDYHWRVLRETFECYKTFHCLSVSRE